MFQRQRILIAHSGKYFGSSIWSRFIPEPEFDIVGLANGIEEAVNMASSLIPDLILVDLSDSMGLGLQTIRILYDVYPYIPIIAYLPTMSPEYSKSVLRAGATECLTEIDLLDVPQQKIQALILPRSSVSANLLH